MSNYLDIIYDSKKIPISNVYPEKLINYLVNRFSIKENQKLLEPGFGRGEFLAKFAEKKIDSNKSKKNTPISIGLRT